jgi:hypothetical protein
MWYGQGFQWAIDHDAFGARVDSLRPLFVAAALDRGHERDGDRVDRRDAHPEIDRAVVAAVWDKVAPGLRTCMDAPRSLCAIAPRPLRLVQVADPPAPFNPFHRRPLAQLLAQTGHLPRRHTD